jgi:hypothetical protein
MATRRSASTIGWRIASDGDLPSVGRLFTRRSPPFRIGETCSVYVVERVNVTDHPVFRSTVPSDGSPNATDQSVSARHDLTGGFA